MQWIVLLGHCIYMKSNALYIYHTEDIQMLGSFDGENAKKNRTIVIKTGINRRINGGGGNSGENSGNIVSKIIIMIEVLLKVFDDH